MKDTPRGGASSGAAAARAWATLRDNFRAIAWTELFSDRTAGFVLFRAWSYLMFMGAASSSVTWNGGVVPPFVFTASSVALCAVLFGAAFTHGRFEQLASLPGVPVVGPALACIGTLLIASSALPGVPAALLGALGAVMTGVGSGLMNIGYGAWYCEGEPRLAYLEVPLALVVAAALFWVVSELSSVVQCVIVAALPAVAGVVLARRGRSGGQGPADDARPAPTDLPELGAFQKRLWACACLVGLADGVVRAVFVTASEVEPGSLYNLTMVWASLITIAVIWLSVLGANPYPLRTVYRITVVVVALFFQLLPIVVGLYAQNVLALAGYGTFNALIWILLSDLCWRFHLSPASVFGAGWGFTTAGVLLGSLFGQALCALGAPFGPRALSVVALAATLIMLLSYVFVFRDSDLFDLAGVAERLGHEAKDTAVRTPRFTNRCKELAEERGLTARETEVMLLYAKGRSHARIQEDLSLSRGTVTTHLQHVYQKLGVHSKQELLDLIEAKPHEE